MFSVAPSCFFCSSLAVLLCWVTPETNRWFHCRGLAASTMASSSTSCCTLWVSTTNTHAATVTSTSKSTGRTSTNVRIAGRNKHVHIDPDVDHVLLLISKDFVFNFRKMDTDNLNTKYDYTSVMHYGR